MTTYTNKETLPEEILNSRIKKISKRPRFPVEWPLEAFEGYFAECRGESLREFLDSPYLKGDRFYGIPDSILELENGERVQVFAARH